MRLTCPSCRAQYEVPAEAIPPGGRDVQCSACGNVWWEQPEATRPRLIDPEPWDVLQVEGDDEEADDLAEAAAAPPPEPPAIGRRPVPPEVERILREEAEREAAARAAEAARPAAPPMAPMPTDPTPPIGPPEIERPVVRRLAPRDLPPPEPAPLPADDPPPVLRRARPADLDLGRVNAALRAQGHEIGAPAPQLGEPPRRRRSGFSGGFWSTIVVLAVLAALYVFRPQIVDAVPQLSEVLDPYARAVDSGRFWLDREIGRLLGVGAMSG